MDAFTLEHVHKGGISRRQVNPAHAEVLASLASIEDELLEFIVNQLKVRPPLDVDFDEFHKHFPNSRGIFTVPSGRDLYDLICQKIIEKIIIAD